MKVKKKNNKFYIEEARVAPPQTRAIRGNRYLNSKNVETAAMSGGIFSTMGPGRVSQSTACLLGADVKDSMLDGIIDTTDPYQLQGIYRDMYVNDHICGPGVDILSNMPWSDFNLTGGDSKQLEVFNATIERLNLKNLLRQISVDKYVTGSYCGLLIFDPVLNGFSDLINFNIADIDMTSTPLNSEDPLMDLRVPKEYKEFFSSSSAQSKRIIKKIPRDVIKAFTDSEVVELSPTSTLYVPSHSLSHVQTGISIYRRILKIYLLERVLFRGTLTELTRRQRSALHIQAGDDRWEPTMNELQDLVSLFQSNEQDPISPVIATRNSVQASEIRCLHKDTQITIASDSIGSNIEMVSISSLFSGTSNKEGTEESLDDVYILNNKNTWAKVDSIIYQGSKPCIHVYLQDAHIKATVNHKFYTWDFDLKQMDIVPLSVILSKDWYLVKNDGLFIPNDIVRSITNGRVNRDIYYCTFDIEEQDIKLLMWQDYAAFEKLVHLLMNKYDYIKIDFYQVSNTDADVYDLHMDEAYPPLFCIESGYICKNSAGDFVKWMDYDDQFTSMKYKALGINDGFLTGDSCLAGDQLVSTSYGIKRIDSLVSHNHEVNKQIPLVIGVDSRYENLKTKGFVYNGERDTFKVVTDTGNTLVCTDNHPLLVINPDCSTDWVETKDVKVGDLLCLSTNGINKEAQLSLRLKSNRINISHMTPSLAILLGILYSANISFDGANHSVCLREKEAETFCYYMFKLLKINPNLEGSEYLYGDTHVTVSFTLPSFDISIINIMLEADTNSLHAFLVAIIDVSNDRDREVHFISDIMDLRKLQMIASTLGVIAYVKDNEFSISPYFYNKLLNHNSMESDYALDTIHIKEVLLTRLAFTQYDSTDFVHYYNDEHKLVVVKAFEVEDVIYLNDEESYKYLLEALDDISPTMASNIRNLIKYKYYPTKVVSNSFHSKQKVYDITMGDQEPSYVAQGIVVHNTYSNMEAALNVFLENMENQRFIDTNAIFYKKLFPLISALNEFTTDKQTKETAALGYDNVSMLNDRSKLLIPKIQWNKQLKPRMNQDYFDVLNAMSEKGVPIPLRIMATATGLDLETLMDDLPQDIKDRETIADYKSKLPKDIGEDEEYASINSTMNKLNGKEYKNSLFRNYPEETSEVYETTRTGKKKWIPNQHAAAKKVNEKWAKVLEKKSKS